MTFLTQIALVGCLAVMGAQTAAAADMRMACQADYQTLCQGTAPGGGRIKACLQQNRAKLSQACRDALQGHS